MAIDTSTFEGALQTKLDATTDPKEMLLLGKALESTVGSIAVSDINTAGATKVAEINTVASNTFKTVGGASILGSGDIATLPSGGTAGQLVTKDAGNTPVWATPTPGFEDTATQLFGTVLSANSAPSSSVTAYTNTSVTLSQDMNNFRGIMVVGGNWASRSYFPIAMFNNSAKTPSDSSTGVTAGATYMVSSYDTYHYYIRRVSDTSIYITAGTGPGVQQIWGIK